MERPKIVQTEEMMVYADMVHDTSTQKFDDGSERAMSRGRFEGEVLARLSSIERHLGTSSAKFDEHDIRIRCVEQKQSQSGVQWEMLRALAMVLTSGIVTVLVKIVWH